MNRSSTRSLNRNDTVTSTSATRPRTIAPRRRRTHEGEQHPRVDGMAHEAIRAGADQLVSLLQRDHAAPIPPEMGARRHREAETYGHQRRPDPGPWGAAWQQPDPEPSRCHATAARTGRHPPARARDMPGATPATPAAPSASCRPTMRPRAPTRRARARGSASRKRPSSGRYSSSSRKNWSASSS